MLKHCEDITYHEERSHPLRFFSSEVCRISRNDSCSAHYAIEYIRQKQHQKLQVDKFSQLIGHVTFLGNIAGDSEDHNDCEIVERKLDPVVEYLHLLVFTTPFNRAIRQQIFFKCE